MFFAWQDVAINCTALGFRPDSEIDFEFALNGRAKVKSLENLNTEPYGTSFVSS